MADRVAILLDGGFVTKKLSAQLGRFPDAADVGALIERVLAEPCLASRELLRVYYYDAPPITDTVRHPIDGRSHDFAASRAYARNLALQRDLALFPDFALRQGELVFKGWRLRPPALDELLRSRGPCVGTTWCLSSSRKVSTCASGWTSRAWRSGASSTRSCS